MPETPEVGRIAKKCRDLGPIAPFAKAAYRALLLINHALEANLR